jgi:hypothetical protein
MYFTRLIVEHALAQVQQQSPQSSRTVHMAAGSDTLDEPFARIRLVRVC